MISKKKYISFQITTLQYEIPSETQVNAVSLDEEQSEEGTRFAPRSSGCEAGVCFCGASGGFSVKGKNRFG